MERSCTCVALIFLVLVLVREGDAVPAAKGVKVSLRAKWDSTSLLMEAGELLAEKDASSFWRFLDSWTEQSSIKDEDFTEAQCAQQILHHATQNATGSAASLFHLSLSLHLASPKLVVYRQLASESLDRLGVLDGSLTGATKDDERWLISKLPPSVEEETCCWVEMVGRPILKTARDLEQALRENHDASEEELQHYDFDHVHPASKRGGRTLVLYGALGTPCFAELHAALLKALEAGRNVTYIYRPVLPPGCEHLASSCARLGTQGPLDLAGYGAELALKNMEYKAADDSEVKKEGSAEPEAPVAEEDLSEEVNGFIFSRLLERRPDKAAELLTFRDVLLSSSDDSDKVSVWELKEIGFQAVQRIVQAQDPLRLMQEISQNFPNVASSLSRTALNASVRAEIEANQKMVAAGRTLLAINRALVADVDALDLFSLIDLVSADVSLASKLTSLGMPADVSKHFLALPEPLIDASSVRVDFQGPAVRWLNDIETDARYRTWRSSLQQILMPTYPGQLRQIRRNLFNAVLVLDPASPAALHILPIAMMFYERNIPVRFGVILVSPTQLAAVERAEDSGKAPDPLPLAEDLSELVTQVFLYLEEELGAEQGFRFLAEVARVWGGDSDEFGDVSDDFGDVSDGAARDAAPLSLPQVEEAYARVVQRLRGAVKRRNLADFLAGTQGEKCREGSLESTVFAHKKGLAAVAPMMLLNGKVYPTSNIQSTLVQALQEETQYIQQEYYYGRLRESTDVLAFVLKTGSYSRYSPLVLGRNTPGSDSTVRYVSQKAPPSSLPYLHHPGTEDDVKPVTHWVVLNLGERRGVGVLKQVLIHLADESSARSRVAILLGGEGEPSMLERVVLAALQVTSRRQKIVPFLQSLMSNSALVEAVIAPGDPHTNDVADSILNLAAEAGLRKEGLEHQLTDGKLVEQLREQRRFCETNLELPRGSSALVTNGRLTLLPASGPALHSGDFGLLENLELDARGKAVSELIEDVDFAGVELDDLTAEFLSDVIMGATSALAGCKRTSSGVANFGILKSEHSAITIEGNPESPLSIEAVIDPLSPSAQKLTSLLVLLHEWLNPAIRVVLNPVSGLSDIPLKNFYRYASPSRLDQGTPASPSVSFSHLPPSRTLTFNLDVPEPWLVEAVDAPYDLDNLRLEQLGDSRSMHAVYALEALMLTGHCFDTKTREPPRGLQLALASARARAHVDTIVMANLGYFQLKAAPGVWNLSLVPGRSTELYTLSGGAEESKGGVTSTGVVVDNFRGKLLHLGVAKRPGKEKEKLLEADEEDGKRPHSKQGAEKGEASTWQGVIGQAKRWLGSKGEAAASTAVTHSKKGNETIHIFAVASGHLYERLMKIMVLSILKRTDRPVKFWFIKNYLSPRFKDFIPQMAREYGFQYELVTYKWPSWLHKQTEKQRIIWAYKILFLDVLFPLDLKKVIFVDADQIVRTDMAELYDMDLEGAPLAYTPFCDNNKDMDGFRFWNQGFWKDHLRGKPYHISALYVVDLARFRHMAAGDQLRVFYESLSKDPNSLANLDQDLPNYAQHLVPIYSLPKEWLWCESWCGNATKAQAKTIDLCNNPMTKEPKLEAARRIVAEWPALDEEQRRLTERVEAGEFDSLRTSEVGRDSSRGDLLGSQERITDRQAEGDDHAHKDAETAAEL